MKLSTSIKENLCWMIILEEASKGRTALKTIEWRKKAHYLMIIRRFFHWGQKELYFVAVKCMWISTLVVLLSWKHLMHWTAFHDSPLRGSNRQKAHVSTQKARFTCTFFFENQFRNHISEIRLEFFLRIKMMIWVLIL